MKLTIYHNNRCRKSREALEHIETKGYNVEIVEYLKTPLSISELKDLIQLLKINLWNWCVKTSRFGKIILKIKK